MRVLTPLTEFDFHQRLAGARGISVVLFTGPDCGACRRLESLLPGALEGQADHLFSVDVQQCMALARAYDIFHLPALHVFVDGVYHAPLHGEPTPGKLREALAAALAGPAQEEP